MQLSSPAFSDKKPVPTKYARQGVVGGRNISLPLAWSDLPPETQSLALSMVDPHPVAGNWVHWCVINIPPGVIGLAEGASGVAMPPGSTELFNTFGVRGYGGPQPPKGSGPHPYEITLYALKTGSLNLTANTTLAAFRKALEGKILDSARLTGIYER